MTTRKNRVTELATPPEHMVATRNLTAALEALVDRHSVHAVLLDLAAVCFDKGDHLRSNWQDELTAKTWDRAAKICDKAAAKVEV